MEFPYGVTVTRERRKLIPDPYNPDQQIPGDWSDPDLLEIDDAAVLSSSTVGTNDATRTQTLTAKSLYLTDPTADVLNGDRVRVGDDIWYVNARPAADTNPWTGWQPAVEIPLDLTEG
jgi:hypothetical protein